MPLLPSTDDHHEDCTHTLSLCILKRLNSSLITFTYFCCLHAPNWILSLQQSKWFEPCKIAHSSLYCDLKLPSLSALLFSDWSFSHSNVCQQEQKPFPFLILHSMGQWSVVVPAETILHSILLPLVNLDTRSALAVSCCCCTWSRDSINQISIGIQSPSVLHVFPCAKNSNCL